MTKHETYKGNKVQLQTNSSTLIHGKQITYFSYQHSISFTQGLQHYCCFGQANMYRLCGLWQISRQIWMIFVVQKRFQLLGCQTQSIHER